MEFNYKHAKLLNEVELEKYGVDLIHHHHINFGEILTYTKCKKIYGVSLTELLRREFGWSKLVTTAGFKNGNERKRTGDYVNCTQCGLTIYKRKSALCGNNFCSQSCSASYNNRFKIRKPWTEESKQKLRNSTLERREYNRIKYTLYRNMCKYCDKFFWYKNRIKYCGDNCRKYASSEQQTQWLKDHPNQFKKFRLGRKQNQMSYMERSFEKWLIQLGIVEGYTGYLREIHFFNKTLRRNGWIDFLFPKHKLIIELDGTHHKQRVHQDQMRDTFLIGRGWNVLRISHREYVKNSKTSEVLKLLGQRMS